MLYRVYKPWRRVKGLRGLTDEQARQVWRPFSDENLALGFTHLVLCLAGWFVLMMGLFFVAELLQFSPHPALEAVWVALIAGSLVAAIAWSYVLTFRAVAAEAIRDVQGMLIMSCGTCGYTLDGLPESTRRCPECGEPVADLVQASYARRRQRQLAKRR
ncbi:MAG: hypothetical protein AAF586_03090 [Planctomycetota bacterium]